MTSYLETIVDKFIFKVASDRHYSAEGVWALAEGDRIRIGMSDFLQQSSGDIAFVEVKPEGTRLDTGDEVAVIETIKTNLGLPSPVGGTVADVNPVLATSPEVINEDPYGAGWLAVIEARDWLKDRQALLDAPAYLELMKGQAQAEARK